MADERKLRHVCGHFPTGVAVVTSSAQYGPVGLTVNSFASVSLDPPLVLFCIHERSSVWRTIDETAAFVVNILAEDQADLCRRFARRASATFDGLRVRTGRGGAPILADSLAYLDCAVASRHRGGDHWIVVGAVRDVGVLRDGAPLTFFRSGHPRLEAIA